MQTTTPMNNSSEEESENFEEIVSFESGQFAIVDAEVIKSLKDKIPLASKAVFVATKQSLENKGSFKIKAVYDDASLRKLVIEPADAVSAPNNHEPVEEGVQLTGHEGDPVKKKLSRIGRIGNGGVPKTGERSYRNKGDSAKGNPRIHLSKGKSSVEARMDHIGSLKGAKRSNYGQPKSKVETECLEFLAHIKKKTITENYIENIENKYEIRQALADVRDNVRVEGKSFDLVYEAVEILDNHWRNEARGWIDDIIRGEIDV